MQQLRVDLDGVPLCDEQGRIAAIFRSRTPQGLLLTLTRGEEVLVPWEALATADIELRTGRVRLEFTPSGAREQRWLGGSQSLVGVWVAGRGAQPAAQSQVARG